MISSAPLAWLPGRPGTAVAQTFGSQATPQAHAQPVQQGAARQSKGTAERNAQDAAPDDSVDGEAPLLPSAHAQSDDTFEPIVLALVDPTWYVEPSTAQSATDAPKPAWTAAPGAGQAAVGVDTAPAAALAAPRAAAHAPPAPGGLSAMGSKALLLGLGALGLGMAGGGSGGGSLAPRPGRQSRRPRPRR